MLHLKGQELPSIRTSNGAENLYEDLIVDFDNLNQTKSHCMLSLNILKCNIGYMSDFRKKVCVNNISLLVLHREYIATISSY